MKAVISELEMPKTTERVCAGREKEIVKLRHIYETAAQNGARFVLVKGAAGIGKTCLIEEFRSRMRIEGAVVFEGRCCSGSTVLSSMAEILRQALSFLEQVGRTLENDLGPLAILLDQQTPLEDRGPESNCLVQRLKFFESYCDVLRLVSKIKPPIIIVHDLHLADVTTIELLMHLLDGGVLLWNEKLLPTRTMFGLILASAREDRISPNIETLAYHPESQIMQLSGLNLEGVSEYFQNLDVMKQILHITGGNPEQLNVLFRSSHGGIDQCIQHQLDGLSPEAHRLLAALAVIGRPSTASLVAKVSELTKTTSALTELLANGLIMQSFCHGEVVLSITREQIGDLIYRGFRDSDRRHLHRQVVESLSGACGLATQELAHHAICMGDAQLAVTAALKAAGVLELIYAYEVATSLLEEVIPLADATQRIVLFERLVALYEHAGKYPIALKYALAVVEAKPTDSSACWQVGNLMVLSGLYDTAPEILDRVEKLATETGNELLLTKLVTARAEMHYRQGNYDAGSAICEKEIKGSHIESQLLLRNIKGKIELARGHLEQARESFQHNAREARAAGLDAHYAKAMLNLGIIHLHQSNIPKAMKNFETALVAGQQNYNFPLCAFILHNLAILTYMRCNYEAALHYYYRAIAHLKVVGNHDYLATAVHNLGELFIDIGDEERALKMVELARTFFCASITEVIEAQSSLLEARIAMARENNIEALEKANKAHKIFFRINQRHMLIEADLLIAKISLRSGNMRAVHNALKNVSKFGTDNRRTRGCVAFIEAEIEKQNFNDPIKSLMLALDFFTEAEYLEGIWRTHLYLARWLSSRDADAYAKHLTKAATIAEKVKQTLPREFHLCYDALPDCVRLKEALNAFYASRDSQPAQNLSQSININNTKNHQDMAMNSSVSSTSYGCNDIPLHDLFPEIVFRSMAMEQVLSITKRIATSDSQVVLIKGESGTGKELIAEALHQLSPRRDKPFIKVNCVAFIEPRLLKELFGHEKDAFTGALKQHKGYLETVNGGTLFLDEIGNISPKIQVRLLQIFQEQACEHVDGVASIQVNTRVLCATNQDLELLVRQGQFHEDLYYRLKGIQIEVPPLRNRREDINPLAIYFLQQLANERGESPKALDPDALAMLCNYHWSGNVRELENVIRSVSLLVDGPLVTAQDLAQHGKIDGAQTGVDTHIEQATILPLTAKHQINDSIPTSSQFARSISSISPTEKISCNDVLDSDLSLKQWKKNCEQACVQQAMERTDGNITKAATLLGVKRSRMSQLIKEHQLRKG